MTRAHILFWLGFVAPWCWLIGGWLPEFRPKNNGENRENVGGAGDVLPTWAEKGGKKYGHGVGLGHGYPFVSPSLESLGGSSIASSTRALKVTPPRQTDVADPWIYRCRVASGVAAIVLTAAFIVAFIIVGTRNR